MSLVGPRPEQIDIVAKYNVWQRRRLKAKPGITGFQQICNRGEPDLANRVKYDLVYLKNQSFTFDLYILCHTIWTVVGGHGITS
jgi:undecaprenyl-phosphate galactose phosphotransferase/UDP-galactose-lipid carrier transferase